MLIFWTVCTVAQKAATDNPVQTFGNTISPEDLETHLKVLASDEYEGRETGKKGQRMAASYISKHFKSLQFDGPVKGKNNYYQNIPLQESGWENPTISVDGKEFKFLENFYGYPNSTQQLNETVNDIVFLGYGVDDEKYSDYAGQNVNGKVIMVHTGEPTDKEGNFLVSGTNDKSEWSTNWRKKVEVAKQKGVKAILIIDPELRKNTKRMAPYIKGGGVKLKDGGDKKFANTFYISEDLANAILPKAKMNKWFDKISKKGKAKSKLIKKKKIDLNIAKFDKDIKSSNVLGFLEGGDLKDEILVITSHYDHLGKRGKKIYNGADDDGSGTVALLEIAEAFAKAKEAGNGPRRSILFMAVSGEEKGLLGSEFYVNNPVLPLENSIANLNIDMVGRTDDQHDKDDLKDRDYVYIIGSDRLSTELHDINEAANKSYTKMNLDYKYNDKEDPNRFYYRSDHYNFAKNNIPIIFYFNGTHEDYHQETDTVEKIEFDMLAKRAQLVFYTAWQLVNQDKRIEVNVFEED